MFFLLITMSQGYRPQDLGPIPHTSPETLDTCFLGYVNAKAEKPFDLGAYVKKSMNRNSAVNAPSILSLGDYLKSMSEAQCDLRFKRTDLEERLRVLLKEVPSRRLNYSSYDDDTFTHWLAKRLGVVHSHARKLKNETRFKEACSKLNTEDTAALRNLIDELFFSKKSSKTSCSSPKPSSSAIPSSSAKRRKLKSEPTLDDNGYPVLLAQCPSDASDASLSSSAGHTEDDADGVTDAEDDAEDDADGVTDDEYGDAVKMLKEHSSLREKALEVARKPLPSKRGSIKATVVAAKLSGPATDRRGESKSFGDIIIGPFKDKSYIQKVGKDGKKTSIINVQGVAEHQMIAWKLFNYALAHETTEQHLKDMRDRYKKQLQEGGDLSDADEHEEELVKYLCDD